MKRFKYEITRHPADTFDKVVYFCSETGQCSLNEVSKDETRILTDILNSRGKDGWELVQVSFGRDGLIAFWKHQVVDNEK